MAESPSATPGTSAGAFKDHFSQRASDYGRYRPSYPQALFDCVADAAPDTAVALDIGTGNGQAALGLASRFERVLASDASAAQLALAQPQPRVQYLRHRAERLPVRASAVAAVAVAQGVHWFEFSAFYAEVRRVLKARGVIALWTYTAPRLGAPIDGVIERFYTDVVGSYWPPERHYVEAGYATLPFPFKELPAPPLAWAADWSLEQLLGYIGTWSAVTRFRQAQGVDPLPALAGALRPHWPGPRPVRVEFPIYLRIGRV